MKNLIQQKFKILTSTAILALTATPAMAFVTPNIPEPSVLSLIAIGVTGVVLARIVKRRK